MISDAIPPARPGTLPLPDADALAHSARVTEAICTEVRSAGGALPFWRFMELALYAPGLGYYVAGSRKFGAAGDFVTAPEISPLFSHCLARQCAQVFDGIGGGDLLEFGAGSGAMAAEVLRELQRLERLPVNYFILEVSADLAERQRQLLGALPPELSRRVVWLSSLPPPGFRGVILANEVLDAMPVHRFRLAQEGISELAVACDGERLRETTLPAGARLADRIGTLVAQHGIAAPYESEINFAAEEWVASLAAILEVGAALLVDYGFSAGEFWHPQRSGGTLMCHYRHRAHGDALLFPGLQDITAHVDFTAIAEAAHAAGLHVAGYANQAGFLLATGLLDALRDVTDPRARLELTQQVNKLTAPGEMGELFKVLALTKGIGIPLRGFSLRDDRGRL